MLSDEQLLSIYHGDDQHGHIWMDGAHGAGLRAVEAAVRVQQAIECNNDRFDLLRQLTAAQAVIAEVRRCRHSASPSQGRMGSIWYDVISVDNALSQSPTDALQAHDRQVAAKALTDAAIALWGDETAEAGTTKAMYHAIYATWLEQRAASLVPGNPEPTEGEKP